MHITLRRDHVDDMTDLVIETRRGIRGITDRLDLQERAHRLELQRGDDGLVLHARQVPAVPAGDDRRPGLAVGLLPLFPDNRRLPEWPTTWTPEGRSIRFDIEYPDTKTVLIDTGPGPTYGHSGSAATSLPVTLGDRKLQPASRTGRPYHPPTKERMMHLTLRQEWVDGSADVVVESGRRRELTTDRFSLEMDSQRVELQHGDQGLVLIATYAPGVPTPGGHQLGLAVGVIPLFGDNRPLPERPTTWQADGSSVRFEIECPDRTDVEITTA